MTQAIKCVYKFLVVNQLGQGEQTSCTTVQITCRVSSPDRHSFYHGISDNPVLNRIFESWIRQTYPLYNAQHIAPSNTPNPLITLEL